jgi:hypothetical protein
MEKSLQPEQIQAYREQTFGLLPSTRLGSIEAAIAFVNQRGFVYFWPIKDVLLPSLWVAVAGDRPVPNNHDDPGHVTWGWKDSLLGQRRWFYGKILRKKATIIALEVLPYFYALTQNYGSPEEDHLIQYQQGLLSSEAKTIYDAILNEGPLDAIALRKAARLTSSDSTSRFNRALAELQADLKLMPVGVAQAGAWRYAFVYEIVARHHPEIIDQTRFISDELARRELLLTYFKSIGAGTFGDAARLFQWRKLLLTQALDQLVQQAQLLADLYLAGTTDRLYAVPELLTGVT